MPNKKQIRAGKEQCSSQIDYTVQHGGIAQDQNNRLLVTLHPKTGDREMDAGVQLTFSFLFSPGPQPIDGATNTHNRPSLLS